MEEPFKVGNDIYSLKIQLNSTDKMLFTLKKTNQVDLIYYKKELQYEELMNIFKLSNTYSSTEKILEFLKKAKIHNKIKIIIENDKAKLILYREVDFEEKEFAFEFEESIMADQELNKKIFKEIKEIREKMDKNEKEFKEEIKKKNEEINQLKQEIKKLNENKLDEKNEITLILKVDEEDITKKEIHFLNGFNDIDHSNNNEINGENIDVYINNEKVDFINFIRPESIGYIKVKLVFKKLLTDCSFMFTGCENIVRINFQDFNAKKITSMKYMFSGCINLEKLDLSSLNTINVKDMEGLFGECNNKTFGKHSKKHRDGCKKLKFLKMCKTENVTNMSYMFSGCERLKCFDGTLFDTSNVTNMSAMFYNFKYEYNNDKIVFDSSLFITDKVTNMSHMFHNCSNFNVNNLLKTFNTKNVTDMSFMFQGCDISGLYLKFFNTEKVTNMSGMFYDCQELSSLSYYNDISFLNTKNVTNMSYMFYNCKSLCYNDLCNLDISNCKGPNSVKSIFYGCGDKNSSYYPSPIYDFSGTSFSIFDKNILINSSGLY